MFTQTPIYTGLVEEVLMFGHVLETCEHSLRKDLCHGPGHYPPDHPWDEPPF